MDDNILDPSFAINSSQIKKVRIQPGLIDHDLVPIQLNCKPIILRQMSRQVLLFNNQTGRPLYSISMIGLMLMLLM